jgi:DNA-binding transcriptional regulator YdaS (Cro superfamily)
MIFKDYWRSLSTAERPFFAVRVGASVSTLNQLAFGDRVVSDTIALAIERETDGAVTVAELRPAFAESLRRAGYVKVEPGRQAA